MKKSVAVPATFVAAYATLVAAGCATPRTVRRCVDATTRKVLPDSYCQAMALNQGQYVWDQRTNRYINRNYGYEGYRPMWGYGGDSSGGFLRNYSTTAPSNADIMDSNGRVMQRATRSGGFGSFGRSFGGSS